MEKLDIGFCRTLIFEQNVTICIPTVYMDIRKRSLKGEVVTHNQNFSSHTLNRISGYLIEQNLKLARQTS